MIYWGIHNQGDTIAWNFKYYVEINNKTIGGDVSVVSPNHVSMFGTPLSNLGIYPGQRIYFKLTIDPEGRIPELNERNNYTEMVFDY